MPGVTTFHGGLTEIGAVLAARADSTDLARHVYAPRRRCGRHGLRVAGLDSMVVGEAQIPQTTPGRHGVAAETDAAGRLLHG
jgi:glutamyl-tRNA reductase